VKAREMKRWVSLAICRVFRGSMEVLPKQAPFDKGGRGARPYPQSGGMSQQRIRIHLRCEHRRRHESATKLAAILVILILALGLLGPDCASHSAGAAPKGPSSLERSAPPLDLAGSPTS